MIMLTVPALLAAILTGTLGLAALLWSLWRPHRRLWPPRVGRRQDVISIGLTYGCFGAVVLLALAGWGGMDWPPVVRRGVGGALLVAGHVISAVTMRQFGARQIVGGDTGLRTEGLYRCSRNPQYLACITLLLGWAVLSAAPLVWAVLPLGLAAFAVAPLTEEPWLRATSGTAYDACAVGVRRFL